MLVRLTEVCQNTYTVPTAEDYTLREVFINPEHVVIVREEYRIKQLNEQGLLCQGLKNDHRFSKIVIDRGNTGTEIVVIGAPEIIEQTLQTKKQILRG